MVLVMVMPSGSVPDSNVVKLMCMSPYAIGCAFYSSAALDMASAAVNALAVEQMRVLVFGQAKECLLKCLLLDPNQSLAEKTQKPMQQILSDPEPASFLVFQLIAAAEKEDPKKREPAAPFRECFPFAAALAMEHQQTVMLQVCPSDEFQLAAASVAAAVAAADPKAAQCRLSLRCLQQANWSLAAVCCFEAPQEDSWVPASEQLAYDTAVDSAVVASAAVEAIAEKEAVAETEAEAEVVHEVAVATVSVFVPVAGVAADSVAGAEIELGSVLEFAAVVVSVVAAAAGPAQEIAGNLSAPSAVGL